MANYFDQFLGRGRVKVKKPKAPSVLTPRQVTLTNKKRSEQIGAEATKISVIGLPAKEFVSEAAREKGAETLKKLQAPVSVERYEITPETHIEKMTEKKPILKGASRFARGFAQTAIPGFPTKTEGKTGFAGQFAGYALPFGVLQKMTAGLKLAPKIAPAVKGGIELGLYEAAQQAGLDRPLLEKIKSVATATGIGAVFGKGGQIIKGKFQQRAVVKSAETSLKQFEQMSKEIETAGKASNKQIRELSQLAHKAVKEAIKSGDENLKKQTVAALSKLTDLKKTAGEFAGNINISKYSEKVGKKLVNMGLGKTERITHEQTLKTAAVLKNGTIIDKIVAGKKGRLAAEMTKERQILADVVIKVDDDVARALEQARKVSKATGEIARAEEAFKIPIGEREAYFAAIDKQIRLAGKNATLRADLEELKRLIAGQTNIPGFWDKVVEGATAFKLTNPITHLRNTVGNTWATIMSPIEKTVAGVVNPLDPVRIIKREPRSRFIGEGMTDLFGKAMGIKKGTVNAVRALWNENFAFGRARIAEAEMKGHAIVGLKGKIIRFPFRMLTAGDEFFRAMNNSANSWSLAYRHAAMKGLKGRALMRETERLARRYLQGTELALAKGVKATGGKPFQLEGLLPHKQVMKMTSEQLYQAELDKGSQLLNKYRNQVPWSRLILAFFKTPVDVTKYYLHRSPIGLLSKRNWEDMLASSGSRADALARITIGSAITAAFVQYALEGRISGSGQSYSRAQRDLMMETGWRPYSVYFPPETPKVGDTWVSYRGFEPIAGLLGFAADAAEAHLNKKATDEQKINMVVWGVARNVTNQPYLMGVHDTVNALADPERYAEDWASSFIAGTTVPTGLGFIQNIRSRDVKTKEGLLGVSQGRLPGLAERLPTKINVLGNVARQPENVWHRIFRISPVIRDNPVVNELVRLDISIPYPSRYKRSPIDEEAAKKLELQGATKRIQNILVPQTSEKISIEEYNDLLIKRGPVIKKTAAAVINSPVYRHSSDTKKKVMLQLAIDRVLSEYSEFRKVLETGLEIPSVPEGNYFNQFIKTK